EAVRVGPAPSRDSYLQIERILDAARTTGAEAIHPGYGFLSEQAAFVEACDAAGITFIGPRPAAITAMGDKTEARQRMIQAGVPVVPGMEEPEADPAKAKAFARSIGFPVMIKAAAGGGGRGMRRVDSEEEFDAAFAAAQREALAGFGD